MVKLGVSDLDGTLLTGGAGFALSINCRPEGLQEAQKAQIKNK